MDKHSEVRDVAHSDHPEFRHEKTDINPRIVIGFAAALVVAGIVIHALLWLLFDFFGTLETRAYPREYPMVQATEVRLPPSPRLQEKPREDLKALRQQEDQLLNSYTWINQQTGAVRIPISEAMKRLVEQGFPVSDQPAAPAATPTRANSGRTADPPPSR